MAVTLTPKQQQACLPDAARVIVSAGAGSGKTRVLVERFVRLVKEKRAGLDEILTVTFTNKAANEMRERILQRFEEEGMRAERERFLEAPIETIHGFCARLLNENKLRVPAPPDYRIVDRTAHRQLLEKVILGELEQAHREKNEGVRALFETYGVRSLIDGVEGAFDKLRSLGLAPEKLSLDGAAEETGAERQGKTLFRQFLISVWQRYEEEKRRAGILDHDDLQLLARDLLRRHPYLLARTRNRYKFIMVDEFQDTNPLQVEILELLRGPRNDFYVGDKKQAIYGFRHAEVAAFNARENEFAADAESHSLSLDENFRSRPEVIDFVNRLFAQIWEGDPHVKYVPLVAAGRPENARRGGVEIALVDAAAGDENFKISDGRAAEASWIVERIARLVAEEGYRLSDIVLLMRSTTELHLYQQAFSDAGIPLYVVSGRGFYAQQEIFDVVNFLKAAHHPQWDIPLAGFLRSPFVSLSDDTLFWIARAAKAEQEKNPLWDGVRRCEQIAEIPAVDKMKIKEALARLEELRRPPLFWDFPRLIEEGIRAFDYGTKSLCFPDGAQRLANIQKLLHVAREYEENFPRAGLADFLAYLDRLEKTEKKEEEASLEEEQGEVVRVMTIHQAKGLEFPAVFVADLGRRDVAQKGDFRFASDGKFALKVVNPETGEREATPFFEELSVAHKERERAEKKRLFYVAATRAKEKLFLVGTIAFPAPDEQHKKKSRSETPLASKPWAEWLRAIFHLSAPQQSLPSGTTFTRIAPSGERGKRLRSKLVDFLPKIASRTSARPGDAAWQAGASPAASPGAPRLRDDSAASYPFLPTALHVTVTQLMHYAVCPYRYRLLYRLGWLAWGDIEREEKESSASALISATDLGTITHRVLELADFARLESSGLEILKEFYPDLTLAETGEILRLVDHFAKSQLFQEARAAETVFRERSFLLSLPGAVLEGTIDLLFLGDGKNVTVVDYKTSAVTPETLPQKADEYRFQLELYLWATQKLFAPPEAPKGGLFFLQPGAFVSVESSKQTVLEEKVSSLVDGLRRDDFTPRPSLAACARCAVRPICPHKIA